MNSVIEAVILGIVQGISEWLPVSSSGHLVIFQQVFGLNSSVLYDTLLHLATLAAVIVIFWKDILSILKSLISWDKSTDFHLFWQVALATVPIVIVGLLLKNLIESLFSSTRAVSFGLIFTGAVLWATKYFKSEKKMSYKKALAIGIAQVLALVPGVSRSGMTISAGLFAGLKREKATRFSFLIFIPAVAGAGVLQASTADWSNLTLFPSLSGMLVAFIVSLIVLKWLINIVKKGKLHYFAWYCWLIGLMLLGFSFVG